MCAWAAHSLVLAGNSSLAPWGVAWREENQWQLLIGATLLCDLKLSTADVTRAKLCCLFPVAVARPVLHSSSWHLNLT